MSASEKFRFGLNSLAELTEQSDTAGVWLDENGLSTRRDFMRSVQAAQRLARLAGIRAGDIVVAPGEAQLESLAWLFGLALEGAIIAPLRASRQSELEVWSKSIQLDWQIVEGRVTRLGRGQTSDHASRLLTPLRLERKAGLILGTGGTTGVPKILLHDLSRLLLTIEVKSSGPRRLLPLMRFDHIGGLDMSWRALASGHVLVAPPLDPTPESVASLIDRYDVEIMPATPSFLNLLLVSGVVQRHSLRSLRVVPYGAEKMPNVLLKRLQQALPQVEFRQRFGTSETGALPVRDQDEVLILPSDEPGFRWEIRDQELWIKSPARALGYLSGDNGALQPDGWFRTGDLVERIEEDKIRVIGRRSAMINVGGEKVFPEEIEALLLAHPLIEDCRVRAESSALLGQVPVAEIVWRGGETNPLAVKKNLHGFLAGKLDRAKWPVSVRLVSAITSTHTFKKQRLA